MLEGGGKILLLSTIPVLKPLGIEEEMSEATCTLSDEAEVAAEALPFQFPIVEAS